MDTSQDKGSERIMAWHYLECPDCEWYVTTRSAVASTVRWAEHFREAHTPSRSVVHS